MSDRRPEVGSDRRPEVGSDRRPEVGSDRRPGTGPTAAERAAIAEQVAECVLATPGVVRLEPTLRTALLGLRSVVTALGSSPTPAERVSDGIVVTSDPAGRIEVAIDLAAELGRPAVDVAIAVRERVNAALAASHAVARIDVSILTITDD